MTRPRIPGLRKAVAGVVVAILVLCPVVGAGPAAAQVRSANPPEVTRIDFEGNRSFSDRALARAIVTRQTECRSAIFQPFCWADADWAQEQAYLNPRTLSRDLLRIRLFYYQRGFREASVDTTTVRPAEDEVRITFHVEEGRPVVVDSLGVVGLAGFPEEGVAESLPIEVGAPLSGVLLDATRDSLITRLQNRGYAHAEVLQNYFVPAESPYSARVTFDVFPGRRARFGALTVVGNDEVSETVVRQMLPFREGDVYRQNQIYEAQRSLYNLEIFRHAEIRSLLDHRPDSVVPLQIQVNEGDVHRVRAGAGWNNGDCVNAETRWSSRNFFGGARRLQIRGRISNILAPSLNQTVCNESGSGEFGELNWLASADFSQPWVFSPRNSLSGGVFAERQSLKDIFVRKALGFNVGLTRNLGGNTTVGIAFRPELSTLDAAEIFFCTSFLVCDPDDIDALQAPNWLSPLILSLTRDRSNGVLNPTRGYTVQVELEHASRYTGADFSYNRAVAETRWYTEVTRGWVAAARLRGGWVSPRPFGEALEGVGRLEVVHPQKRFFGGGSNSVRGFAQNQLGPRVLSIPVRRLIQEEVCAPAAIHDRSCDAGGLDDDRFTPRPTGGSQLLEGSLELRFPFLGPRIEGAVFMDFGQVWDEPSEIHLGDLRFTPGLGVRYATPIGPVRVDVGYQLRSGEPLRVVTSQLRPFDPDGGDRPSDCLVTEGSGADARCQVPWVLTDELALLEPRKLYEDDDPFSLGRFQLHFSIGQAF